MQPSLQYPIFGAEIHCPHCRQLVPALTLTDTYLCPRHGAFEADPQTGDLIHVQSGRCWRLWENEWYRQHTHPDGIRFEIHEALDKLYTEGYRATKITIAVRYRDLLGGYLERTSSWRGGEGSKGENALPRLYGLPVVFSPTAEEEACWGTINFYLEKEQGVPVRYPYFRYFE